MHFQNYLKMPIDNLNSQLCFEVIKPNRTFISFTINMITALIDCSFVLSTQVSCSNRSVSELFGQLYNKSDIPIKFVTSCQPVASKFFQIVYLFVC